MNDITADIQSDILIFEGAAFLYLGLFCFGPTATET